MVDLIENDRGLPGDLYRLRIPTKAARVARKAGKLRASPPVFRELGHPSRSSTKRRAVKGPAGAQLRPDYPHRAVQGAPSTGPLETRAAWNLVTPRSAG